MKKSIFWDDKNHQLITAEGWVVELETIDSFEFKAPLSRVASVSIRDLYDAFAAMMSQRSSTKLAPMIFVDGTMRDGNNVADLRLPTRYPSDVLYLESDSEFVHELTVDNYRQLSAEQAQAAISPFDSSLPTKVISLKLSRDLESIEISLVPSNSSTVGECLNATALIRNCIVNPRDPRTAAGVFGLIVDGHPEALVGQNESVWLEVKQKGYGFKNVNQKHEFALDLAALANTDMSGVIVIGLKTERDSARQDTITEVCGCTAGSLAPDTYISIANDRVIPALTGLQVQVTDWKSKHIMAILVPPQPEHLQPFVVRGGLIDSGRLSGAAVTIPHRVGSSRWNMTPEAVHSMLVAARVALRDSSPPNTRPSLNGE